MVLLLLKIIGILLLALIGLLVGLLLLVLLVPVRYWGRVSLYGQPRGLLAVSWLFHLLSVRIRYEEGLQVAVRLFGYPIFRDGPGERRGADEDFPEGPEPEETEDLLQAAELGDGGETPEEISQESKPGDGGETPEEISREPEPGDGERAEESSQESAPEGEATTEETRQDGERIRKAASSLLVQPGRVVKRIQKLLALPGRIVKRIQKLLTLPGRVVKLIQRLLTLPVRLYHSLRGGWERAEAALHRAERFYQKAAAFLAKEENKKTFRLVKREAGRVLRHLRPRKFQGEIHFGLEDPYQMGQILSAAAFIYPFTGDRLTLVPCFDRKLLEGEISLRGRIRLGTLLAAAVRLLLDKNLRNLCRKFMNRGGI